MKVTKLAILISISLSLIGCGKSASTNNASTKSTASSTTTTTTTNTTTVTPTPPAPSSQATQSPANRNPGGDKLSKPEDAARGLFDAWGRNDREAAKKYASNAAIADLFKDNNDTSGMSSQGCSEEPGGFNCAYIYDGGALIMHIKGSDSSGYKVEAIEYIAD